MNRAIWLVADEAGFSRIAHGQYAILLPLRREPSHRGETAVISILRNEKKYRVPSKNRAGISTGLAGLARLMWNKWTWSGNASQPSLPASLADTMFHLRLFIVRCNHGGATIFALTRRTRYTSILAADRLLAQVKNQRRNKQESKIFLKLFACKICILICFSTSMEVIWRV
jgi:hypothetical protein